MIKPLCGMRILVCGKGGSGKSSIVALMATILRDKGYEVLALDGDGSNPGGLSRLMFGLRGGPKPLIEFFGGREKVTCPVDDPSPLTRVGDLSSVTKKAIHLDEIPPEYFVRKEGIALLQTGKIESAYEGCDGPMSKVTRDFVTSGEQVTLIDVEAGVEHFGRGVEKNVDIILTIVDPTFESFLIAERVNKFASQMRIENVWMILNKVESEELESIMMEKLKEKKAKIIGVIPHDSGIARSCLEGIPIGEPRVLEDVEKIVNKLEITNKDREKRQIWVAYKF